MDVRQPRVADGGPEAREPVVGHPGVLCDLLPLAIWSADSDGRVVQWALAAEQLLGYPAERLLGRHGIPLLVPESNRALAEELAARVLAGETLVGAYPVRHQDGHLVEMEMWICPSTDPQGRPGITTVAAETSAVRRMRDSLAALEGLFAQSPIGLALFDTDLRYVRVNEALARMNGVPAEQHPGRRVRDVVPDIDHSAAERAMRQVLRSGRAVVDLRTGRTAAAPGEDRTWSCSYAPLTGSDGQALGVIASLIDITAGQQDHLRAERARQRFALLAEAGKRIGTTLDLRQAAAALVEVLVPHLADTGDVLLLEEVLAPDEAEAAHRGLLCRLAFAVAGPGGTRVRRPDTACRIPPDSVYAEVLASGRPRTAPWPLPPLGPVPEDLPLVKCVADLPCSARIVPLMARGRVLGLVIAARTRGEPFDEQDTVLVDELVDRAALSIDNARLYTGRRHAALVLQRSLLRPLPDVPGLELAGCYLPASRENEVGGDWFDVLKLPGGRTGLVIGDVVGHGIKAASIMGQLRTVVRTLAAEDIPPARLLGHLDSTVAELGDGELATCVYAVLDAAAESCLLARAGHPPPAVTDGHGAVRFLDGTCGTPLGVQHGQPFDVQQVRLPRGSTLVLYTDGLIERRGKDLDRGLAQLADTLRQPGGTLAELCDRLLARLLTGPPGDDVAVLLARPR